MTDDQRSTVDTKTLTTVNPHTFVGTSAAIANAVFDATDGRVTDLPITLDKLV